MLKRIFGEKTAGISKNLHSKEKHKLVQELRRDDESGEATLKLIPKYGDRVYYEVGALATEASSPVENLNEFKTKELKLSFLCVDSKREHETGEPVEWKNKITIKYRVYDKGDKKIVELISAPHVPIKYTTDGSNPKDHGGIYDSEVIIPKNTTYVLAVAETEGVYSDSLSIKIDWQKGSGLQIDKNKSLNYIKGLRPMIQQRPIKSFPC